MAIPNNYIDKITKDGESRPISPAADKVRVNNENFEGSDLDEVLDEIHDAIEDAGEGGYTPPAGGIPKTDLASDVQTSLGKADTAYQKPASGIPATDLADGVIPDTANLATKTEVNTGLAGKVDKVTGKGLSTNDYTDADKAAVGTIGSKANAADVPSKVSDLTNDAGYVTEDDVEDMMEVSVPTIDSVTGNWIIGGQVTQYPSRGQDGNSGVASADGLESVNNLNGGTTDTSSKVYVLGANQGKRLKDQIDYIYGRLQAVYAALGNAAFWDEKTAPSTMLPALDWGNPKHTVTLALSLTHAVVKHNGETKANGATIQVEEGATLTLTVEAEAGYQLQQNTIASQVGTVSGNEVSVVMGGSNITLDIEAEAVKAIVVNKTLNGCTASEESTPASGSAYHVKITPPAGKYITGIVATMDDGNGGTTNLVQTVGGDLGGNEPMYAFPIELDTASVTGDISISVTVDDIYVKDFSFIENNNTAVSKSGWFYNKAKIPIPTGATNLLYVHGVSTWSSDGCICYYDSEGTRNGQANAFGQTGGTGAGFRMITTPQYANFVNASYLYGGLDTVTYDGASRDLGIYAKVNGSWVCLFDARQFLDVINPQ